MPPLPPGFKLDGQPEGNPIHGWAGRVGANLREMVTGEQRRTEDLPDLFSGESGIENKMDVARARAYGDEADVIRELQEQGIPTEMDDKGNAIVTLPNGERRYVDRPGLTGSDVAGALAKAGPYVAAGMAARKLPFTSKLPGRAAVTGGVEGVTDYAIQKVAGRENVDLPQVGTAAAMGGAFELAAPLVLRTWRAIKSAYSGKKPLVEAGRKLADDLGLEDVTDEMAVKLARDADQLDAGVSPEKLAGEGEFGFRYTRGQKTGDFDQLSLEERLRNTPGAPGRILRQNEQQNAQVMGEVLDDMQARMGSGTANTADDAAEVVRQGVMRRHGEAKAATDAAYDAARAENAMVDADALRQLPKVLGTGEDMSKVRFTPKQFPQSSGALEYIQQQIKRLDDAPGGKVTGIRMDAVENIRRDLGDYVANADRPADRRIATQIKKRFDDFIDSVVDTDAWRGARAAKTLEAQQFTPKNAQDIGRKTAQALTNGELSSREVVAHLYNDSGVPKKGATRIARHLRQVLGRESEGFQAMKEMVFLRQVQNPQTGELLGPRAIVSNIRRLVQGRESGLAKELLTNKEIAELGRFSNALEGTLPKGDFARSSGTTERALRTLSNQFPVLRSMVGWNDALQAHTALRAVPVTPQVPSYLSGASVALGHQTIDR